MYTGVRYDCSHDNREKRLIDPYSSHQDSADLNFFTWQIINIMLVISYILSERRRSVAGSPTEATIKLKVGGIFGIG